MRDPNRIPRIIAKLQELWLANPDWRLSQLVVNSINMSAPNVYYAEDERLEAGLDDLIEVCRLKN